MSQSRRWLMIALGVVALSALSLWQVKLALLAGLATLIGFVALPKLEPRQKRAANALYALASVCSAVALVLFVQREAFPSLVTAGNEARGFGAVSRLREILFIEDVMRQKAYLDPDHDGIGSAGLVVELSGKVPLRGRETLSPPLLNQTYSHIEDTKIGPAAVVAGYFLIVCLPRVGGGFTARPGDPVDDESAERRFVAYAWPAAAQHGSQEAYFLDEHENILLDENGAGGEPHYAGQYFPPPCDAALAEPTRGEWRVWKGKKPRTSLPGDR